MNHFSRAALAYDYAQTLDRCPPSRRTPGTLLLSGPAETGKSTFLKKDLRPQFEVRNIMVISCALAPNEQRDPISLVADAIGTELLNKNGMLSRWSKSLGPEQINIARWMRMQTASIGSDSGLALTDAMAVLHRLAGKPIAVIVDDVQHALNDTSGVACLLALRGAVDQLNRHGQNNCMLIAAGNDEPKMQRLVNAADAPFFGAAITPLPLLRGEFVEDAAKRIARQRPDFPSIDADRLMLAFDALERRPGLFTDLLASAAAPCSAAGESYEERVLSAARQWQAEHDRQFDTAHDALRSVERTLVHRILDQGNSFSVHNGAGNPLHANAARRALDGLCTRTPPLVWKSAGGEYEIHDPAMVRWYDRRRAEGTWPPSELGPATDGRLAQQKPAARTRMR